MRFRAPILLLLAILSATPLYSQGNNIVTGYVREEGSNTPVPAATLEISRSGSGANSTVISGIAGEFVFRNLEDSEYVISARKDGFNSATVTINVMRTGAMEAVIFLRRKGPGGAGTPGGSISSHQLQVPKAARAFYEKGRKLLEDENNPSASVPEFEKAVNAFPSYYEAYTKLGVASYHLGNISQAEVSLKKAVELSDNKFVEPLYLLADLYNSQRKYQDAEPLARQATTLDNSNWNSFFELARSQVGLKQPAEAEANALRARDLAPQNPQICLVLANVHVLQQNYRAAVEDFEAYLKLDPEGPNNDAIRRTRDKLKKQVQTPPAATPPSGPASPASQP